MRQATQGDGREGMAHDRRGVGITRKLAFLALILYVAAMANFTFVRTVPLTGPNFNAAFLAVIGDDHTDPYMWLQTNEDRMDPKTRDFVRNRLEPYGVAMERFLDAYTMFRHGNPARFDHFPLLGAVKGLDPNIAAALDAEIARQYREREAFIAAFGGSRHRACYAFARETRFPSGLTLIERKKLWMLILANVRGFDGDVNRPT